MERHGPSAAPRTPVLRRLLGRAAEVLVPSENPTGTIYGLMLIGALLAAESGRRESYADTLLSAVIAAALYWLAHGYAAALGQRLQDRRRLTPAVLVRALGRALALIRGASIPLLALALAALLGASQQTAVTVAVWSAIVSLAVFELLAGVRAGASRGELALETVVGATMGLAILALKVVLH